MRLQLPVFVLIAAALSIAGAGCGGSSKTGSSSAGATAATASTTSTASTASTTGGSGAPLSKSQLISQADAICKQLSAELDVAKNSAQAKQSISRVAVQRASLEQTALTELSKFTPPASMAHDYQQLLAARQTLIADIKKLGEAIATGKVKAAAPIYASSALLVHRMEATARRDGFRYCGSLG